MITAKPNEVNGLAQVQPQLHPASRLSALGARRRSILMMPVAGVALHVLPYRASAIGPLAALQGVASVVSIVSGIAGMA
jgi:hypothetical protein